MAPSQFKLANLFSKSVYKEILYAPNLQFYKKKEAQNLYQKNYNILITHKQHL